jgi:hypothetical protein
MVLDADAIVIESHVMGGEALGFTKAFIERTWSLDMLN